MSGTGEKIPLSLTACSIDESGNVTIDSSNTFEVMLNPSSYKHEYTISYNKKEALGQIGSDNKFSGIQPEKVSFELLLDGTGAVAAKDDVKSQVKKITAIVYAYDGSEHEPSHVRLLWGSMIFFARLESMNVDYTLFQPSGEPLRAKINLSFSGFMSKEEEALRSNRSSPDLSHDVIFKAGDSLPLLCEKIYKDSRYYLDVAKHNNIANFRDIAPGTKLLFPPLR